MDWLDIIISITGATGILVALLKYFGEKYIDLKFNKEIENYKQILISKTEMFKSDLAIHAHEQTTRFTRLDEKRALILEEIFEKIYSIQKLVYDGLSFNSENPESYINNLDYSEHLTKELSEQIRDLSFFRGKKRIYFTKEIDDLLSRACEELTKVREITKIQTTYQDLDRKALNILQNYLLKNWHEVHQIYYDNFEPLKLQITDEFRKFIGVK